MVASKAKAAVSTMATKTTTGESMLWGSPIEFWDLWGVRLLFIGAVVGVGGLVLSALSAYVLYRVADVAQKDLAAETSRAATELAQAQADIEKSKAESAHANERIAELSTQAEQLRKNTAEANAQAARAQLELEKFKRPRSISEEQRNRIAEKMTEFPANNILGWLRTTSQMHGIYGERSAYRLNWLAGIDRFPPGGQHANMDQKPGSPLPRKLALWSFRPLQMLHPKT